jgi:hypothetical protein
MLRTKFLSACLHLADSHCEESVLAEVRQLLDNKNPNDRMEAVRWPGYLSALVQPCQVNPCAPPEFHSEPVRELLRRAVEHKNVAIGDLALQYLATLDLLLSTFTRKKMPATVKRSSQPCGW